MEGTTACRINELPDSVLLHILCFLPIKVAVKTSVLSKRWRYLCTAIPSLEFDHKDFPLSMEEAVRQQLNRLDSPIKGADLFTVLNQFLLSHDGRLDSFNLSLTLKNDSERRLLGRWIHHVIATKKVTEVYLKTFLSDNPNNCYKLLLTPFSCRSILQLRLSRCYFDSQEGNEVVLSHLRSLSLRDILTNEGLLSRMLSACPQLEDLSLDLFSSNTNDMQIVIPKLMNLRIVYSEFSNLKLIAPSLQFLEFDCRSRFTDKACVSKLEGDLVRLKSLKACTCFFEAFYKANKGVEHPQFNDLEVVAIHPCSRELGLEYVASLLGNCPVLRSLYIEKCSSLSYPNDDAVYESVVRVIQNLRRMSVESFNGTQSEMKLVKYVLKGTPSLELVTIDVASMDVLALSVINELLHLQKMYSQLDLKLLCTRK
ncbi:F-box/FBD/LRR-repeat protein At1g13570-like isoform X3 [Nymphaea colorata]|uniref:F-box/FBD/LRR-repeat protein At1g13570-like isoform X3 n=1 Tax=Nymphaea colorata TaxID=210225 RepID=UPI00129D2432|nr:F-box/FBD/LRR-repeat protein At1g13570-like isoform X3 [Nymphaea colorata]